MVSFSYSTSNSFYVNEIYIHVLNDKHFMIQILVLWGKIIRYVAKISIFNHFQTSTATTTGIVLLNRKFSALTRTKNSSSFSWTALQCTNLKNVEEFSFSFVDEVKLREPEMGHSASARNLISIISNSARKNHFSAQHDEKEINLIFHNFTLFSVPPRLLPLSSPL